MWLFFFHIFFLTYMYNLKPYYEATIQFCRSFVEFWHYYCIPEDPSTYVLRIIIWIIFPVSREREYILRWVPNLCCMLEIVEICTFCTLGFPSKCLIKQGNPDHPGEINWKNGGGQWVSFCVYAFYFRSG